MNFLRGFSRSVLIWTFFFLEPIQPPKRDGVLLSATMMSFILKRLFQKMFLYNIRTRLFLAKRFSSMPDTDDSQVEIGRRKNMALWWITSVSFVLFRVGVNRHCRASFQFGLSLSKAKWMSFASTTDPCGDSDALNRIDRKVDDLKSLIPSVVYASLLRQHNNHQRGWIVKKATHVPSAFCFGSPNSSNRCQNKSCSSFIPF